jgi:hypothetical protein
MRLSQMDDSRLRQMTDESTLRELARAAIRRGTLPNRRPERMSGTPGVGDPCAMCDQLVTRKELEFELQFVRDGDNPGLDKLHVHVRCFAVWELERTA